MMTGFCNLKGLTRFSAALMVLMAFMLSTSSVFSTSREADKAKARHYYMRGAVMDASGNYGEAYELFKKAYQTDSTNPAAAMKFAEAYSSLNTIGALDTMILLNALDNARPLVENNPDDYFIANIYASLRSLLMQNDEAISVMERFLSLNPGHTGALEALTDFYIDNNDFDKAVDAVSKYQRIDGEDPALSMRKAAIYLAKGDTAGILNEADRLISTNPGESSYWVFKGQMQNYINLRDSARQSFNTAVSLGGVGGDIARLHLAEMYLNDGDSVSYNKEVYEALVSENLTFDLKNDLLHYYVTGIIRDDSKTGERDLMIETLLRQYPNEPKLMDLIWSVYAACGEYERAAEYIEYCIDLDPVSEKFRSNALLSAYWLKDFDLLDRQYQRARRDLSPLDFDLTEAYVQMAVDMNHGREAIAVLDSVITRDYPTLELGMPLDVSRLDRSISEAQLNRLMDIYQMAGDAYFSIGDDDSKQKAFVCYDNVLSVNPANTLVLNNYSYFIVRDDDKIDPQLLEKADRMSQRAVNLDPRNPVNLDTRAWVLYRIGNIADARDMLLESINIAGENNMVISDEYYQHLGDIYERLGDDENACNSWQKALEINPDNQYVTDKLKRK